MRRRGGRNEEGEEREGGKEWRRKGMGRKRKGGKEVDVCVWRGMGVNVEQKSSNQYFYKYLATSHLPA